MLALEGTYNSETVLNCMSSVTIYFPVDDHAGVTTLFGILPLLNGPNVVMNHIPLAQVHTDKGHEI